MAEKAVKAAQTKAKHLGTLMRVSAVGESGRLVLCARGDGASFSTMDTSRATGLPPRVSAFSQGDERIARVGAAVLG